jgi:protein O-mannosyl-transferase
MKIKTSYIVLFLTFLVLLVYYPMVSAGFNTVDDVGMINWLLNTEHFNLKNLFLPGGSGYYYRPLLGLTFIADKYLWGLLASFMHLENILLHTINSILVFFIGIKIFKKYEINNKLLPFSAALLFALHPVNTEAVNWISGRTDVLAGCFILFSVLVLLTALEKNNALLGALAAISFSLGCLSKETTVFFFPAALFLIYSYDKSAGYSIALRFKKRFILYMLFMLSLVSYFLLRHLAFVKNDSGISTATKGVLGTGADVFNTTRIFLKVMGFYIKKLFIPWPLNFGIINVSNYYVIVGIALSAILLYLLYRKDLIAAVYVASVCTILPAFLVAMGAMAWTRIAERYLYISSATFAIGITHTVYILIQKLIYVSVKPTRDPPDMNVGNKRKSPFQMRAQLFFTVFVFSLFAIAAITTARRNLIWQDNLSLFQDTVEKSPDFLPAKNELASALLTHGRTSEAFDLIRSNTLLPNANSYKQVDINKAKVMVAENDLEGARKLLLTTISKPGKQYNEIIKELIAIDEKRAEQSHRKIEKLEVRVDEVDLLKKLYARTSDPFYCYRIGQIYLFMNNKGEAQSYFEKAYEKAPSNAHYRSSAKKFAERLKP